MTKLSPAARAVAWAYDNAPEKPTGNHRYHWLAAALRAAADVTVPEQQKPDTDTKWRAFVRYEERNSLRTKLLAIALELEGL